MSLSLDGVIIANKLGMKLDQKVHYEFKPRWCDYCKQVGHETNFCKRKPRTQKLWIPKHSAQISDQNPPGDSNQTQGSGNAAGNQIHVQNQQVLSGKQVVMDEGTSDNSVHVVHVEVNANSKKSPNVHAQQPDSVDSGNAVHVVHVSVNKASNNNTPTGNSWMLMQRNKNKKAIPINSFTPLANMVDELDPFTMDRGRKIDESVNMEYKGGDFNTMINDEEKIGGIKLTDTDTRDFNTFIEDCHLLHLKTVGNFLTWSNKQDCGTRVWCRLDRTLVNSTWIQNYNSSHVEYMSPSLSDHCPALISIYEEDRHGKKPFRFFKMWTKHSNYLPTVSSIWQKQVKGCKMYSVFLKLKNLREVLKDLNRNHFGNISEQVCRAKNALEEVQQKLQIDPFNQALISQEKESLSVYNKLLNCEISFLQQKAKIQWSVKGDRNISYFHSIIKSNRHHNRVLVLNNSLGRKITEEEEIVKEIISYYKNLMGTAIPTSDPSTEIIQNGPCLDENHIRLLSAPISNEEIRKAVFSIPDNKSPGPDGYGSSFFKSSWNVIGDEVTHAIQEFFQNGKLLGAINSTSITLIPKVHCPNTPADFRPISCCNCLYKVISKILATRIQSVMGYLISNAQSAFVKGRNIASNILLAHELVKNYGRKHISPRVMINIDIRKAFDTTPNSVQGFNNGQTINAVPGKS
ncbi:uncharacterized protein LOC109838161 [Asparagus officinalis]|uniref:uncharacterized protein LOC109838161 n=1 Tax=Asparagus officinalis TaxID=4686 RepID=UPI00098DEE6C|nr:uncharacterized protein LOC109838161 [Asparagus officinalis]